MKAYLELECIGDDTHSYFKFIATHVPGYHLLGENPIRLPWVARIRGRHPVYKLDREFLRADKDYTRANSTGSRGVFRCYWLEDGIYEVNQHLTWKQWRRYFCRAEQGRIIEITREEVEEWLNASSG